MTRKDTHQEAIPMSFKPPTDEEMAQSAVENQPKKGFAYKSPAGDVKDKKKGSSRVIIYVVGGVAFLSIICFIAYSTWVNPTPSGGLANILDPSINQMSDNARKLEELLEAERKDLDEQTKKSREELKKLGNEIVAKTKEQKLAQENLTEKMNEFEKVKGEKIEAEKSAQTKLKEAMDKKTEGLSEEEKTKLSNEIESLKKQINDEKTAWEKKVDDALKAAEDARTALKSLKEDYIRNQEQLKLFAEQSKLVDAAKGYMDSAAEQGAAIVRNSNDLLEKTKSLVNATAATTMTRPPVLRIVGFVILAVVVLSILAALAFGLTAYFTHGQPNTGFMPFDSFISSIADVESNMGILPHDLLPQ